MQQLKLVQVAMNHLKLMKNFRLKKLTKGKELLGKGLSEAVKGSKWVAENAKHLSKAKVKKSQVQTFIAGVVILGIIVGVVMFIFNSIINATPGCGDSKTTDKLQEFYEKKLILIRII